MIHPLVILPCSLITIVLGLAVWKIISLSKQLRASEHILKKTRDDFEMIMMQRTSAWHESQLEKTAALYRMAEFGRLSSGLFHDLMHPLQDVIAAVDGCVHTPSPETITHMKTSIARAWHASHRMGNFLQTIRNQMNPSPCEELFSLNQELRDAIAILRFRAHTINTIISTKMPKELITFGNPLKFHQVAINLLANALDASEPMVTTEPKLIHVRLSKFNSQALLKITDHGCGIPAHVLGKIFDPFFTTKSQYRGMGLGLSTTERIVRKDFGGTISVSSTEGQGTCFTVLFPIRKQPVPTAVA